MTLLEKLAEIKEQAEFEKKAEEVFIAAAVDELIKLGFDEEFIKEAFWPALAAGARTLAGRIAGGAGKTMAGVKNWFNTSPLTAIQAKAGRHQVKRTAATGAAKVTPKGFDEYTSVDPTILKGEARQRQAGLR
jgi:hypothetical protein